MQNISKNEKRDTDPVKALHKIAKEAEQNPFWVGPAYQKTQPKTLYDTSDIRRDELKFLEDSNAKKCG